MAGRPAPRLGPESESRGPGQWAGQRQEDHLAGPQGDQHRAPGRPPTRLPRSHRRGPGSAPARGTKMPETTRHKQNYRNRHEESSRRAGTPLRAQTQKPGRPAHHTRRRTATFMTPPEQQRRQGHHLMKASSTQGNTGRATEGHRW